VNQNLQLCVVHVLINPLLRTYYRHV